MTSDLFEEFSAVPNQSVEREISLTNPTDAPLQVRIVQADYVSGLDGASYYPAPEERSHPWSSAAWVALPRTSIVVGADTTVRVPYSITVPADVPSTGTYWSVLMVEPDAEAGRVAADAGDVQIRVTNRYRYAVHVATNVGTGVPDVTLAAPRLVDEAEGRYLKVDLRNEGTAIARPSVWIETFTESGESAGRIDGQSRPLYPGSVATVHVDLRDLPRGRYAALLYVDAGLDEIVGSRLTLDLTVPPPPVP